MSLPLPGERPSPRVWELLLVVAVVLGLCALGCASSARARHVPPSVFHGARYQSPRSRAPSQVDSPRGRHGPSQVDSRHAPSQVDSPRGRHDAPSQVDSPRGRHDGHDAPSQVDSPRGRHAPSQVDSPRGRKGAARQRGPQEALTAPARPAGDESAALVERRLNVLGYRFGTDGSVPALWGYLREAHRVIPPAEVRPGDVLFFDTRGTGPHPICADHVALAESVSPEGRITFVEARGGQVRRSVVDPGHPSLRRDARGQLANSFLRPMAKDDPADSRYFAGDMLCAAVRLRPR